MNVKEIYFAEVKLFENEFMAQLVTVLNLNF